MRKGLLDDALSAFGRWHVGGEVPEWLKGTDCKSVGFAYAGSNPALSTKSSSSAIRSSFEQNASVRRLAFAPSA